MQVLSEQHISARRRRRDGGKSRGRRRSGATGRATRRATRRATGREHHFGGLQALRTIALALLTVALGAILVVLVPELEDEAARAGGRQQDTALHATVSSFAAPESGRVEFEQTEDVEYFVEEGETLSSIARRYRIDYRVLAEYNGLADPNAISVGQRITIPGITSRRPLRE